MKNKIEFDAFAGFNPAKAYTNFAGWFSNFMKEHPDFEITKENLQSDFFEQSFQTFAKHGYADDEMINSLIESSTFKNNKQAWSTWNNAIKIYKVIKQNKDGKWITNVNHIWYKNQIINSLPKQIDNQTQSGLAKIYKQDLQTFINEYLTSKESRIGSAFDSILYGLVRAKDFHKEEQYNDLRKIFWCFQHYGVLKNSKGEKLSFSELYKKANPKDIASDDYKQFTLLLQSLNLCKTFGEKANTFEFNNLSFDSVKKEYVVQPPKAPSKYPFTEKEVDYYLTNLKTIKSKLPKSTTKAEAANSLYLATKDERLQGMNVATLGEYMTMLKVAYKFEIEPKEVWNACVLNHNKPLPGNQWIKLKNGNYVRFNTKLDSELNGMYTATGGHADMEILTKSAGDKYNYSIIEPTVYDSDVQSFRQEQDSPLHILNNKMLKSGPYKINKTSFTLVSLFDEEDKPSLKEEFDWNIAKQIFQYKSYVDLSVHCYSYKNLPSRFEQIDKLMKKETYFENPVDYKKRFQIK